MLLWYNCRLLGSSTPLVTCSTLFIEALPEWGVCYAHSPRRRLRPSGRHFTEAQAPTNKVDIYCFPCPHASLQRRNYRCVSSPGHNFSKRVRFETPRQVFPGAVLQLCRSGLICCANAPCVVGFRSVQVEAIRTGSHPSGGWLVSAFFIVVPGRRGVARRARSARRSRHGVALGPAVCPRNGTTIALSAQTDQRQLAGGRDLHPGKGKWVYLEEKTRTGI